MRSSRAPVLVVLAMLAAGCRRDAGRALREEALAAQRSVAIPAVPATGLAPPAPRLRILVGASGLDVDAVDLFASWPEPRRARLLQALPEDEAAALPFVHRGLVRIADGHIAAPDTPATGQLEIRPLTDVLAYARELERRYARMVEQESREEPEPPSASEVNVYAAEGTPYELLVSVLYTAGQCEYRPTLVLRGPGGDVALPPSVPPDRRSIVPRIVFGAGGLTVTLEEPAHLRRSMGSSPWGWEEGPVDRVDLDHPRHWRRALLAADRACPSVPHRDGSPDLARLRDLLAEIHRRVPDLDGAVVVPAADTPWRAVAGVIAMAVAAGLPRYQIGIQRTPEPPRPCSDGVGIGELQPWDSEPLSRWR